MTEEFVRFLDGELGDHAAHKQVDRREKLFTRRGGARRFTKSALDENEWCRHVVHVFLRERFLAAFLRGRLGRPGVCETTSGGRWGMYWPWGA